MKLINIITHPVLVLVSFCVILISGEHFGGFYLLYIMMALPHGGIHAVLALIGAGLVLFSYAKYKRGSKFFIDLLLNIVGVFALYGSLLLFFWNSWEYNDQTFQQGLPLFTIILFVVLSLSCLIYSIAQFARTKPNGSVGLLT